MTAFENLSTTQKLRASLHRDVRAICTETLHLLGMEMTKPAMEIVAELVYKKLSVYGLDLEAFAKHAKRNTVNSEDVKLLTRRNPSLKSHLNTIQPSNPQAKDKRRKTVAPTVTPFATPVSKPRETIKNTEVNKRKEEADKTNSTEDAKGSGEDRKDANEGNKDVGESTVAVDASMRSDDSVENRIFNQIEHMAVDDTIDLTFD